MAGKEFPLDIILRTIDKSTAVIRAIDKSLEGVSESLDKIGKKAAKIGKSMTTNLTVPIVAVGAASVKAFVDFEDQMASVETLVDSTTESMVDMSKEVLAIGSKTPVALEKLTGALFDIRSGGTSAANAMNVLERSAQLGVAGLGTTEQAARIAVGAINAWGLEGEAADRIFNTVFQTTKNGITTIEGLEKGFGAVAGKIAGAGIEVEDYFASVAALTTTTLKAAQAHTQMRSAVDGLQASNKRTSKIWRKLGVKDFEALLEKSGGVTEAFRAIAGAAGDQSGALKKLIGSSEGEAAVLALVGAQGDKQLSTRTDMLKETVGLTDAEVAYNKKLATTASSLKITKNRMQSAAISIGIILAPAVEKLAEKLQEASAWWENLDDGTKETIVTIAGIVAVVGPAVLVFAKMATAIGVVTTAIRLMGIAMTTTPLGAAIAIIAGAAGLIILHWGPISEFFSDLWDGVKGIFEDASDFLLGIIEDVMAGVDRLLQAVDDVQAHLSGKQTSGELAEVAAENQKIADEFFKRTGGHLPGFAPQNTLSGDALSAFESRAQQASLGPAALPSGRQLVASGGMTKIEVDIKNLPPGSRVKTTGDDKAVDLTTGFNMLGDL